MVFSFLETYYSLCKENGEAPIKPFTRFIGGLLEANITPNTFKLNGNSNELRHQRISDKQCEILLLALNKSSFLVYLDLSFNAIGDHGALAIANLLTDNSVIRFLNLSGNSIQSQGANAIALALTLPESGLVSLNISRNPIGNEAGMSLASMLQVNTTLKFLDISGTGIPAQSLVAFATVLLGNRNILYFNMADNCIHSEHLSSTIQDDVVQHLCKTIRYNTTLVSLNLSKFSIKDRNVVNLLSIAINENKTLVELDLSSNKLMGDSGRAIAKALHNHPSIAILNFSHNQLLDSGTFAICEMLGNNTTLQVLNLMNNGISSHGLIALANSLTSILIDKKEVLFNQERKNKTLTTISISGNKWDPLACEVWHQVISGSNPRIHPDFTDVTFFKPSDTGTIVDTQHNDFFQVAQSPAVTLALGPGTFREPTPYRKSRLPAKYANIWIGNASLGRRNVQKTALFEILNAKISIESNEVRPWEALGGLTGLVGTAEELQPVTQRCRTPEIEAQYITEVRQFKEEASVVGIQSATGVETILDQHSNVPEEPASDQATVPSESQPADTSVEFTKTLQSLSTQNEEEIGEPALVENTQDSQKGSQSEI